MTFEQKGTNQPHVFNPFAYESAPMTLLSPAERKQSQEKSFGEISSLSGRQSALSEMDEITQNWVIKISCLASGVNNSKIGHQYERSIITGNIKFTETQPKRDFSLALIDFALTQPLIPRQTSSKSGNSTDNWCHQTPPLLFIIDNRQGAIKDHAQFGIYQNALTWFLRAYCEAAFQNFETNPNPESYLHEYTNEYLQPIYKNIQSIAELLRLESLPQFLYPKTKTGLSAWWGGHPLNVLFSNSEFQKLCRRKEYVIPKDYQNAVQQVSTTTYF